MKRYILIIFGSILAVGLFFGFYKKNNSVTIPSITSRVVSSLPLPTPTPYPLPKTLSIPKLGVQADIEHVGETPEGRMDVPKNEWNVAWYERGPKPGQKGNSVFAGHLDTATGSAVFFRLAELEVGDEYSVTDVLGNTRTFVVASKEF